MQKNSRVKKNQLYAELEDTPKQFLACIVTHSTNPDFSWLAFIARSPRDVLEASANRKMKVYNSAQLAY